MQRDGYQQSLWQTSMPGATNSTVAMPTDIQDVVVVGAGITGLSTALALRNAGRTCLVLEAKNIGFGTTGGTSAHINTILELSYDRMISKFGEEQAKLVARGALEAVGRIQHWAGLHAPTCHWLERDAYLFAQDASQAEELDKIVEGTRAVGLPADFVERMPFPKPFVKAARFTGQAQFHPTRYIHGLAAAYKTAGGNLLEGCRVLEVEPKEEALEVVTERGIVRARHLVYATHIPPGVNILHFRNAPYRSYVLSARLAANAEPPAALVYDMEDPYHYYRTEDVDGVRLLIAGGCDHKTGHEEDTTKRFQELEAHVRSLYPVEAITHQWSSQYFEPADGLPYIGRLPMADERIHVATGFNGNGITLGTLASIVLTDLITTNSSPYEEVFDPARVSLIAGFGNFVKEAADVVGHLVAAPFPAKGMKELDDLAKGDGRVVQHEGRSIALHRDEAGLLHAVDPACSHIKCTVAWNGAERSWDCPCHGSRFSVDGEVLTAPARKPLQSMDVGS
ncbi:MAG: FAD-dependent oxidoreductase [Flavobacteriales bacterium]|nr:FAD-dependent oxidoreductase [Flavobacteriales bacterium]MBP6697843.1 FAD-dependent oxidoreductase [Flavobacteriales bacterium]